MSSFAPTLVPAGEGVAECRSGREVWGGREVERGWEWEEEGVGGWEAWVGEEKDGELATRLVEA